MGDFIVDTKRKFDVVPLGRIAVDFNPVDYFKTLSESGVFKKYLGGSPANIAVGLSRLGKKVGFIAKVSDDQFGDFVCDYFKNEGIDTSCISRAKNGEKIGLTFTEILDKDTSSILMYRNQAADLSLSVDDICEEYIKNAKILLISGTALAQSPSREATLKAVALAKKCGTAIIFDVDYRPYNWQNADEIAVYYSYVAEKSDIVMGSREEYDLMEKLVRVDADTAETNAADATNKTKVASATNAIDKADKWSAEYWLAKGNKIVIIKHGKKGSTAYTSEGSYSIKPFPVTALKSFGGGDGYGSAFIWALLDGKKIIDCLEYGSASASMLVSAHGCSDFMPRVAELEDFIKAKKSEHGEMVAREK